MKEENKRKRIIYLSTGVMTLLILVVGVAYAYFQAQNDDGKSANLNATTGTTDNLTFSVSDIDVSTDKQDYVIDEEETESIIINANQDNFGQDDKTIGDGVNGKATLLANSTNNTATMNYNVYFAINENNFKYTTEEKKPEVILKVYDPNNEEVTKITGLNYHEKDSSNPKDISGFDITGRKGVFAIESGHTITTDTGKKEENWKVEVYLINLPTDQVENAGKTLTGVVKITTTEEDTYTLAHINTITPEITSSSIKATVELDENSTNEVTKYYFAIENKGEVETVALSEKTKEEIDNWQMEIVDHHTFNDLDDNTNYRIYSYVVDSEGFESSLYETEIIPTDVILPQITSAEVTDKAYNSLTVNVTSQPGSLAITGYEYEISGAGIDTPRIETETGRTHTFEELQDNTEYTIKVRAVDGRENESTNYEIKERTYRKVCNEGETIEACLLREDKNKNPDDPALLLHNGTIKGTEGNVIDAEDNNYRYSGSNEVVNNYVCFGSTECAETDELYRIIGLFKNTQDQYEMKIIKATYATDTQLGTEGAYSGSNKLYYWNYSTTNTSYDGIGTNDWSKSNLNTVNLNENYLNTFLGKGISRIDNNPNKWQKMIEEHTWITAGNTNTNIYNQKVKQAYKNEITSPSVGTTLSAAQTVQAKVGLMYASDYGYAAYKDAWNTILGPDGYDDADIKANNWMHIGTNLIDCLGEWTITRLSDTSNSVAYININGLVHFANVNYINVALRPTMYLKSNVKIINGYGTAEAPYVISE